MKDCRLVLLFHTSQFGGAEQATYELAVGLKAAGVTITALFPNHGPMIERVQAAGIEHRIIPYMSWARSEPIKPADLDNENYINTRGVEQIYNLLKSLKADVVLTSTLTMPWAAIAAAGAGIPHVWHIHEFGDRDHGLIFDYPYEEVLRRIDDLSQAVITNSDVVKQHISSLIPQEKITRAYYGFELDPKGINEPLATSPYRAGGGLKLIIVGRVIEAKRQLDAVKAVAALKKQGIPAELVILGPSGSDQYMKQITAYIAKHDLADVIHLQDFAANPFPYIKAADVLLMCSENEAFGRVTVEGMLVGKAVVGAASAGTLEIIEDGKTGLLYTAGDSEDLARKLVSLYGQTERITQLGAAAKKFADKTFREKDYTSAVLKVIDDVKASPEPSTTYFFEKLLPTYAQISRDYERRLAEQSKSFTEQIEFITGELSAIKESKSWRLIENVRTIRTKTARKK
jgi:glycosyltransferase involved in cell wall biosynthesis